MNKKILVAACLASLTLFTGCVRKTVVVTPPPADPVVNPIVTEPYVEPVPEVVVVTSAKRFQGDVQTGSSVYEYNDLAQKVTYYDAYGAISYAEQYTYDNDGYLANYSYSDDGVTWTAVYNFTYDQAQNYWYGYAEYTTGVSQSDYIIVTYDESTKAMRYEITTADTKVSVIDMLPDASGWYFIVYTYSYDTDTDVTYTTEYNGGYVVKADGYDQNGTYVDTVEYYY